MNPYERYVLPWLIEHTCGIGPIQKKRNALIPQARGRVLEVGVDTGRHDVHAVLDPRSGGGAGGDEAGPEARR